MSEFLFFILVAVSAGFSFWPYFRRGTVATLSTRDTPLGRVEQRKETLLQNIAELDFEYNMGKLSEEDYQSLRGSLKAQAAEAIEQLDVLAESDAMIGRAPQLTPKSTAKVHTGSDATPAPAAASNASGDGSKFCSQCGTALESGARFCSSCGQPLA